MPGPLLPLLDLPGVEEAVASARAAVDAVLADGAMRRSGPQVALESSLRGARASAALEGVAVDLEYLRSGNIRLDHPGRPVVQAALRVAQEIPSLVDVWRRAPAQALARLHAVAAADLTDDIGVDAIGRPRSGPPALDALPEVPVPSAPAAAERLDVLMDVIASSDDVSALVLAAVVHGELLVLRPFGTRDGLVARAALRLVLRTRGFDPRGVTVPEAGFAVEGRRSYVDEVAGFVAGTPEGLGAWLGANARSIETGATESLAVCRSFD